MNEREREREEKQSGEKDSQIRGVISLVNCYPAAQPTSFSIIQTTIQCAAPPPCIQPDPVPFQTRKLEHKRSRFYLPTPTPTSNNKSQTHKIELSLQVNSGNINLFRRNYLKKKRNSRLIRSGLPQCSHWNIVCRYTFVSSNSLQICLA